MSGYECPNCGDVMPPGWGEDDHYICNWPEDHPSSAGEGSEA